MRKKSKLVIIPTGALSTYKNAGYDNLYEYHNPGSYFDEVVCVSPYNEQYQEVQGIQIKSVCDYKEYADVIRSIEPDVIRAYGAFYSSDYANYYRIGNIPVITSVHDTVRISPSVCFSDKVICVSKVVCDLVREIGTNEENIIMLPNRVDTDAFCDRRGSDECKSIRKRFPKGKMILCVARRCEQKNTDNIIMALTYLPEDYFCVFVGRGDNEYIELAKDRGVGNRCFWIDRVEHSELPYWYSSADCFCLPSRWEGFGIVFIEAAACGLPIVSSNIAPMNEYLNSENSILVNDFLNPRSISEAIIAACSSGLKNSQLKKKALRMVDKFEKSLIDKKEIEIYKEVLERKKTYSTPDLRKSYEGSKAVAIWGAGGQGKEILSYVLSKGYKDVCFIDNDRNKQGSLVMNTEVVEPSDVNNRLVLVPNSYYLDVFLQMKEMRLSYIDRIMDFNRFKACFMEL